MNFHGGAKSSRFKLRALAGCSMVVKLDGENSMQLTDQVGRRAWASFSYAGPAIECPRQLLCVLDSGQARPKHWWEARSPVVSIEVFF